MQMGARGWHQQMLVLGARPCPSLPLYPSPLAIPPSAVVAMGADAAWVRYSAVCGLLRLARAYDAAMPAPLYANLALTFQEPLMEPRRAMTAKLQRTVTLLAGRPQVGWAPGGGGAGGTLPCLLFCTHARAHTHTSHVRLRSLRAIPPLPPTCCRPSARSVLPSMLRCWPCLRWTPRSTTAPTRCARCATLCCSAGGLSLGLGCSWGGGDAARAGRHAIPGLGPCLDGWLVATRISLPA